jgi:carbamoyltransferase
MNLILGISCYYHDSAAVLLRDGQVVFAIQEERLSRIKQDSSFPSLSIEYILDKAGLEISDIDQIIYYEKPLLKFERILSEVHRYVPRGRSHFLKSIPTWIKDKIFFKQNLWNELDKLNGSVIPKLRRPKLLFSDHHLSHQASTYFSSPFASSAILTMDGVGEWTTASFAFGDDNKIQLLDTYSYPHSLGMLYSSFTYFLGFKVNSGEYKLMGLAPYGNDGRKVQEFVNIIKDKLVSFSDDHFELNLSNFSFQHSLLMCSKKKWEALFGVQSRVDSDQITQDQMDLALAIQLVTEEIVLSFARKLKALTGSENIVLSGGVALNCVANGKLRDSGIFNNIWIQPAAGDAGGALGAAYACHHIYNDNKKLENTDFITSYHGPEYSYTDIKSFLIANSVDFKELNEDKLIEVMASLIDSENIIGHFNGRMEWGPRALGNRSILAKAQSSVMQKKLNLKIKFREGFRPFAPIMTESAAFRLFEGNYKDPFMLFTVKLKNEFWVQKDSDYSQRSLVDKLEFNRSHLPATTHIDYSSRIQTVNESQNLRIFKVLKSLKLLNGEDVMINTSFNVRGEPIVCSPKDAYQCFMHTDMDYLVMGNFIINKSDQLDWDNKNKWVRSIKPD